MAHNPPSSGMRGGPDRRQDLRDNRVFVSGGGRAAPELVEDRALPGPFRGGGPSTACLSARTAPRPDRRHDAASPVAWKPGLPIARIVLDPMPLLGGHPADATRLGLRAVSCAVRHDVSLRDGGPARPDGRGGLRGAGLVGARVGVAQDGLTAFLVAALEGLFLDASSLAKMRSWY